jgi:hypothetical protein
MLSTVISRGAWLLGTLLSIGLFWIIVFVCLYSDTVATKQTIILANLRKRCVGAGVAAGLGSGQMKRWHHAQARLLVARGPVRCWQGS